jgi:hypothetical protein
MNAMSLKVKIRNLAKQNNMSAQVVLQNYMFERFLERLASSEYHDKFILKGGMLIEPIRPEDNYGGYRVSIRSTYDSIITPLHIDITTGDAITPKEVLFSYKTLFTGTGIDIWAYNVETIMSEK